MLALIWELAIIMLFIIMFVSLLVISVFEIFSGIKKRDIANIIIGTMFGLVFLMIALIPFVDTQKCPMCNEMYPLEYQYCPKDGTRLEE